MAVTYKSSAANVDPTVNSGNVTVPTVVSGDLIIGFGLSNLTDGAVPSAGTNTPSGWTQYGSTSIFYKISDGTESSTVVDFGGSGQHMAAIVVVTAGTFDTVNPIGALVQNTEAQGSLTKTTGSVAPVTLNTLGIVFIGETDDTSMSGYSSTGISWTEVIDTNNINNTDTAMHVAYGATALNNSVSVVSTSSKTTGATMSVLLFVKERQDTTTSETVSLSEVYSILATTIFNISETLSLTEVYDAIKNGWGTVQKNVSSWLNIDKS